MYYIMKILVFSDSHGSVDSMEKTILREHPDQILHLGDYVRDAKKLLKYCIPLTLVAGNCDSSSSEATILTPEFQGTKIYMTHGHLRGVKVMYQRVIYAALAENADILLFGHTHRSECFFDQGLWVMNPGACNTWGSYGVIQLTDGKITCCLKSID